MRLPPSTATGRRVRAVFEGLEFVDAATVSPYGRFEDGCLWGNTTHRSYSEVSYVSDSTTATREAALWLPSSRPTCTHRSSTPRRVRFWPSNWAPRSPRRYADTAQGNPHCPVPC